MDPSKSALFSLWLLIVIFVGSSAVKAVQKLGVCQEHTLLIFAACHKIVNIRELISLRKLVPDLEMPSGQMHDGDKVLNFVRNLNFPILSQDRFNALLSLFL